jgi:DNA-binding transcriptional ArsR family regulator
MDWNKYSFVARGRNRKRILLKLTSPMTPTQLTLAAEVSISHVSKALRDLRSKNLVECINPEEKVGKIYRRTRDGDEIAEYLLKLGEKAKE